MRRRQGSRKILEDGSEGTQHVCGVGGRSPWKGRLKVQATRRARGKQILTKEE